MTHTAAMQVEGLPSTLESLSAHLYEQARLDVHCKHFRFGCRADAVSRGLCEHHLKIKQDADAERKRRERERRHVNVLQSLRAGPVPCVLVTNTFNPLDYDGDYYDSVDKLYSFMMDRRPDAEEAAFTSSSAAAEEVELPPGLDKITSKWRELRLNFRMGMNLELGQHKVTPQIFSSSINTCVYSR